jgi:protein-L-isoaspartate(D-aspartate) O-methyltransferase
VSSASVSEEPQIHAATNAIIALTPVIEPRFRDPPRALRRQFALNVITLVRQCAEAEGGVLCGLEQSTSRMRGRIVERRQAYAAEIARRAGISDPRIEAAFAAVPREDFAGPPPWRIGSGGLFGLSSSDDPARLYEDVLVAIDAERGINNGQPSLHAQSIALLGLQEGATAAQIGAGAGYYTAILAELVGPTGRVIAYEIEPDIARRAAANLARYPQVEVLARSGVKDLPVADAIYVNAAASHPLRVWLDALKPGARLVFPLQAAGSSGAMLLVTRPEAGAAWPARFFAGVVFIACEGAQDPAMARKLDEAFRRGGQDRVRSLRFGGGPSGSDWLRGDDWSLSTEPVG